MTIIEWFLVIYCGCFVALLVVAAIADEVGSSREYAKVWRRRRIVELEQKVGIPARDSWYVDE